MTHPVLRKVLNAWAVVVLPLLALAFADTLVFHQFRQGADFFFFGHDLAILLGVGAFLAVLARSTPAMAVRLPGLTKRALFLTALGVGLTALAGGHFIMADYGVTQDEFLAGFDARIFASGRLLARIPEAWRPYVGALQPFCMVTTPDHAYWSSGYLPVNAAFRAGARLLHAEMALNPLWTAVAVVATAGVAQKLWPQQPRIALLAVVLFVTSTQLVFNGMAQFAMPAHLALNMLWLCCFLRGGRLGHAGALAIGFLATGLHQLIFHPLFAAPFIAQLWVERRWRTAGLYTIAYGAIALVWLLYWPLAMRLSGLAPVAGAAGGPAWFVAKVTALLSAFDFVNTGSMAKDLSRFVAWQNPLTIPLAVLGLAGAWRAGGMVRSLAVGLGLTILALYVLIPYQDHGWGYRYLHGQLGALCLLAAWSWSRLTDGLAEREARVARTAFVASALVAVLVLFPLRAWQVARYVQPYAAASAAMARSGADVVLIDHLTSWYAFVLTRNDPDLRRRPQLMDLQRLDEPSVRALCARYNVAVFDHREAMSFGIRPALPDTGGGKPQLRAHLLEVMADLRCGGADAIGTAR